jgi:hypothetical protein
MGACICGKPHITYVIAHIILQLNISGHWRFTWSLILRFQVIIRGTHKLNQTPTIKRKIVHRCVHFWQASHHM